MFTKTLKELFIQMNLHQLGLVDAKGPNKRMVIDQLRKELQSESYVPEGVINILKNDLEEIEKQRKSENLRKLQRNRRIDVHSLELIR